MFLRRIFKGMPDLGPWVSVVEFLAAIATLVATLMALNVVPSPFSGPPAGIISGSVLDATTGKPVPEATVQIVDATASVIAAEAVPNQSGEWKETVKPGTYSVKVVCDGYRPVGKTVTAAQGKTRFVRIALSPSPKQTFQTTTNTASPSRVVEASSLTVGDKTRAGSNGPGVPAAIGPGAPPAQSSSTTGPEQEVAKLVNKARALFAKGDKVAALDALAKAQEIDPTDGNIYALIIKIDLESDNYADAKEWAAEGKKYVTKNRAAFDQAAALLE